MTDEFKLTEEQEQELIRFWNEKVAAKTPPALKECTIHIFKQDLDGRSNEGKAVKSFLASRNIKVKTMAVHEPVNPITLTDEHKLYIENHADKSTPLDIAKEIFQKPSLSNLHSETRAVAEWIRNNIHKSELFQNGASVEEVPSGAYESPKSLDKVLRKVNLYLNSIIDKDKISPQQKKGLESLLNYMHTFRFVNQMNTYEEQIDRSSFEDAFVRYMYNKPEMSQEEVDQYIMLSNEVVISVKAQKRSEKLQKMLEDITDNSPENARIAMSLVEAIGKAQTEYNMSIKRQTDLFDDLTEKRSDRLSKQIKDNASVLNLLEAWRQEETRKKWLKLADIEQRAVSEEIERLETMEDIKAQIFGITKEEITKG